MSGHESWSQWLVRNEREERLARYRAERRGNWWKRLRRMLGFLKV